MVNGGCALLTFVKTRWVRFAYPPYKIWRVRCAYPLYKIWRVRVAYPPYVKYKNGCSV